MKTALVCGAGGFIGGHLVKRLKDDGLWVRAVDVKPPDFGPSSADQFLQLDLRDRAACEEAMRLEPHFDYVYQLAADMGGMGFIHSAESEIMRNNALINLQMVDAAAAAGIPRYFFSSSVCIYRDMEPGEPELSEEQAYPAMPDNEYGWLTGSADQLWCHTVESSLVNGRARDVEISTEEPPRVEALASATRALAG